MAQAFNSRLINEQEREKRLKCMYTIKQKVSGNNWIQINLPILRILHYYGVETF